MISMFKRVAQGLTVLAVAGVTSYVVYTIMTKHDVKDRVILSLQRMKQSSKERMNQVTEEVALHTAQVTNNPKINQDWVAQQWSNVGW